MKVDEHGRTERLDVAGSTAIVRTLHLSEQG